MTFPELWSHSLVEYVKVNNISPLEIDLIESKQKEWFCFGCEQAFKSHISFFNHLQLVDPLHNMGVLNWLRIVMRRLLA